MPPTHFSLAPVPKKGEILTLTLPKIIPQTPYTFTPETLTSYESLENHLLENLYIPLLDASISVSKFARLGAQGSPVLNPMGVSVTPPSKKKSAQAVGKPEAEVAPTEETETLTPEELNNLKAQLGTLFAILTSINHSAQSGNEYGMYNHSMRFWDGYVSLVKGLLEMEEEGKVIVRVEVGVEVGFGMPPAIAEEVEELMAALTGPPSEVDTTEWKIKRWEKWQHIMQLTAEKTKTFRKARADEAKFMTQGCMGQGRDRDEKGKGFFDRALELFRRN